MLDLYFKFILNDDGTYLGVEYDKRIVEEWIKHNYYFTGKLFISDDLIVDCSGDVSVENINIDSLTNGLFRWGNVDGDFYCGCCNITSLEGAPKDVNGSFDCSNCTKLKSLEGAPEKIGGKLNCRYNKNLKITDSDREKYKIEN